MSVLSIHNLEKQEKDRLLFSSFNLEIDEGEVAAIHSSLDGRVALLNMVLGKSPILNGEIFVLGQKITKESKLYDSKVAISFFEEGFFGRLSVKDHITFYMALYDSDQTIEELVTFTQLGPIKNKKVSKLTFSEKRRLNFALIMLQNPTLYIFEEPDLNVDMETKRVLLNILENIKKQQKSVLVLTGNMESAITMADSVYRLSENGIHKIEMKEDVVEEIVEEAAVAEEETPTAFNFNKIPTKVNEKIILFDPPEIDYIESNDGQSHVYIKGETFPSVFTLNELEERLQPFGFFRCHRSYIVNLQKVREVITWTRNSYSLVLDDKPKSTIPLSKTKMVQLKEMLGLK